MQLFLPSPINFNTSPNDVALDSLVRKMYQPKRTILYPRSPYAAKELLSRYSRPQLEGLGYDYNDVLQAAGGLLSCDPHDSGCVARNTQVQAAAQDIWVQNEGNASVAPMPVFTVTPNVGPSVVGSPTSPFFQNAPANEAVITFQGQAPETTAQLELSDHMPAAPVYQAGTDYAKYGAPSPLSANQSVPPTTPLAPMKTPFQNTADKIASTGSGGSAGSGGASLDATQCKFWESPNKTGGCDTNLLLLGGAAAVGLLLFMMGGKR